ncbi:transposase [Raineyella sp. W15-4]|uniref:transposase n=1 Tax=Raineyella sp. W15-4 TaxID=3081651 RepID=UPI0029533690|nr:transposase [Raineyella sp. W15-4]WOQ16957.1 transposase [Raineyella sp. W15-4]
MTSPRCTSKSRTRTGSGGSACPRNAASIRRSPSGCWPTRPASPLDLHVFEANLAETTTLLAVIEAFQTRHQVSDMVVADAGMLSAANLNALEDAGLAFIVAARQSKAPAELESHFEAHGNYLPDGATFEVTRPMGIGKDRRDRRVVWHYLAGRARRDQQARVGSGSQNSRTYLALTRASVSRSVH